MEKSNKTNQQCEEAKNQTNKNKSNKSRPNRKRQQPRKDSDAKRVNFDNARIDKFEKDIKKKPGYNDISWYARNPELMKAAASIPFSSIVGNSLQLGTNFSVSLPGIIVMNWEPNFGCGLVNTAMNQAANDIYSFLVHANSRNYTYEPSDLMILTQAGMQPFLMIAAMTRAYGIVKTYKEQNRYLPDHVLMSLGFEPNDFRMNLGKIWFDINEMVSRTTQIWIPNTMPILQRWFWLNTNVYKDAEGPRAQLYLFNQARYYQYNPTFTQSGGALEPLTIGNDDDLVDFTPGINAGTTNQPTMYTWSQWRQAFNNLMTGLLADEDRGNILGDILNAYGLDKLYALSPIQAEYRIEPVYNQEVLTQIENSTVATGFHIYGLAQNASSPKGSSNLYSMVADVQPSAVAVPGRTVLNFHHDGQPTPEEIVIATRLVTMGISQTSDVYVWDPTKRVAAPATKTVAVPTVSGSEIIVQRSIVHGMGSNIVWDTFNNAVPPNPTVYMDYMSFDWAPFWYALGSWVAANGEYSVNAVMGDYDNYTVLNVFEMKNLHEMAFYSLFGVPQTWIGGQKAR